MSCTVPLTFNFVTVCVVHLATYCHVNFQVHHGMCIARVLVGCPTESSCCTMSRTVTMAFRFVVVSVLHDPWLAVPLNRAVARCHVLSC